MLGVSVMLSMCSCTNTVTAALVTPPAVAVIVAVLGIGSGLLFASTVLQTIGVVRLSQIPAHTRPLFDTVTFALLEVNVGVAKITWPAASLEVTPSCCVPPLSIERLVCAMVTVVIGPSFDPPPLPPPQPATVRAVNAINKKNRR